MIDAVNRGYQQGRADEQLQSIEDAKMQATEYLNALDKAKKEAYQQGAREFAEKIKSEIEECWYWSELDVGSESVNSLIDSVLAEWQKKGTENE